MVALLIFLQLLFGSAFLKIANLTCPHWLPIEVALVIDRSSGEATSNAERHIEDGYVIIFAG